MLSLFNTAIHVGKGSVGICCCMYYICCSRTELYKSSSLRSQETDDIAWKPYMQDKQ